MENINSILKERGSKYGSFKETATLIQAFKDVLYEHPNSKIEKLEPYMAEAIEMVFHKLGRILAGNDSKYLDSWVDCIGYLQLVVDEIQTPNKHRQLVMEDLT